MLAALVAAALQVGAPPPIPAWMIGDYLPGPWIVFVEGGRPISAEASAILDRVHDHASRFPDGKLTLCLEGRAGPRREEGLRRGAVRRELVARGLKPSMIRYADDCRYQRTPARPPGVIIAALAD